MYQTMVSHLVGYSKAMLAGQDIAYVLSLLLRECCGGLVLLYISS